MYRKIIIVSVLSAVAAGIASVLRFERVAPAGLLLLGLVPVLPDTEAGYYLLVAVVAVAFVILGVFAWRRHSPVFAGVFCALLLTSVTVGFIRAERISAEVGRAIAEALSRGSAAK